MVALLVVLTIFGLIAIDVVHSWVGDRASSTYTDPVVGLTMADGGEEIKENK